MSVVTEERCRRRVAATEALALFSHRPDASQIVARLDDGLSLLRNLLYTRIQTDVQRSFGMDSMLMPISRSQTEYEVKGEMEAFVVAEVLDEMAREAILPFPAENRTWLFDFRLADRTDRDILEDRADHYLFLQNRERQLEFSDRLEEQVREARLVPLVLYQLFPLAVRCAAALSMGDHFRGGEIRNRQMAILPAIADCRYCHGRLMEVDESCRECGNPVWTIRWMTEAD